MVLPVDWRTIFTDRQAKRNFMMQSIYPTYGLDVSRNEIIRDMKELGFSYRRQTMLEDINFVQGLQKYESQIRNMDPAGIIPKAYQREVPYNLRNQGQYRYKVTVFDEDEGEIVILDRAESTNNWYTKDEAEENMGSYMRNAMKEYKLRLIGVDLYEVWTKEGGNLTR